MKCVLGLTVFAILSVGDWSSAAEDQVESVLIDLRNGGNRETARAFSRIRWLAWEPEEARQIVAALADVMQESVESFGAEAAGAIECLASRRPRETRDAGTAGGP